MLEALATVAVMVILWVGLTYWLGFVRAMFHLLVVEPIEDLPDRPVIVDLAAVIVVSLLPVIAYVYFLVLP